MVRVGKYEIGRTLGEGNFAKVKLARHVDSGRCFAVKILERKRVLDLRTHDQVRIGICNFFNVLTDLGNWVMLDLDDDAYISRAAD